MFISATSGSISAAAVSSTKLNYRPSTGRLTASSVGATSAFIANLYGTVTYAGGISSGTMTSGTTSIIGNTTTTDIDITGFFSAGTFVCQVANIWVMGYTFFTGNTSAVLTGGYAKQWNIPVFYNGTTFVLGTGGLYGTVTAFGASGATQMPPGGIQAAKAALVVNTTQVLLRLTNATSATVNTQTYYSYFLHVNQY
jgi:hypothetical protein